GDMHRTAIAGRVAPGDALSAEDHAVFVSNAEEVARLVAGETGLRTLFHHHCAAFVETPTEIARFLDASQPGLIDLVFDTGHYTYGCGVPDDGSLALDGLKRFWERVAYVHLKDCHPAVAADARARGLDYTAAVGAGVFCELGRGSVDLEAIVEYLRLHDYHDWVTVEQDVLPGMGTPKQSAARNRRELEGLGL
ncbi:MAG TPA: TIM barrel protein, partial [Trueperaceae bacterium]|nr:TIM barrel protein [Trueperaceae bacterium]